MNKTAQSVINLGSGGTATLTLDITYFPQKSEKTEEQLCKEFLDSILPTLISSMNLGLESELKLLIHSLVQIHTGPEGFTYQFNGWTIIFGDEVATCAKYPDEPNHHHYLCKVICDTNADPSTFVTNYASSAENITSGSTYGDFLKIPDLPLQKLFSYLDFYDLKTFSVLSKDMRKLVLQSLINSSCFTLKYEDEIDDMLDFMQTKIQPKNIAFYLDPFYFQYLPQPSSALLKLFTEWGPHISHLEVRIEYGENLEVPSYFNKDTSIPVLGQKLFPSLKSITINVQREDGYSLVEKKEEESYIPLIKSILGNTPALIEVNLKCGFHEGITSLLFRLVAESGLAITILKVTNAKLSDKNLGYLKSLKLEVVGFEGIYNFWEGEFTKFLESHRHTLTELSVGVKARSDAYGTPQFTFPVMEKLETFELKGEYLRRIVIVSFKDQLPKLKRLKLKSETRRNDEDFFPPLFADEMEPSSSVKEVIFSISIPITYSYMVRNCVQAFNSLSKLEIPVSTLLCHIWRDLPELEELTLLPSNDMKRRLRAVEGIWIDESISGLYVRSAVITDDDFERYEEQYNPYRSMEMLKKLRLLRLRHIPEFGSRLMLTDISFWFVISRMESLKCIDFCGTHPSFVGASKNVLDEIGKTIVLLFGNEREWCYQ